MSAQAINIPLNLLRLRFSELDADVTYIAYCDTGGRGSTAAYLLMREGFDLYYLAGGLAHTPLADAMSGTGDRIAPNEPALDASGRMPADVALEAEPLPAEVSEPLTAAPAPPETPGQIVAEAESPAPGADAPQGAPVVSPVDSN